MIIGIREIFVSVDTVWYLLSCGSRFRAWVAGQADP